MNTKQKAGRRPAQRLSGQTFLVVTLVLGLLTAGTTHLLRAESGGDSTSERLAPMPPIFLRGAMAVLLTNRDGFAARITMETRTSSNRVEIVSGELWGRQGKLLFVPEPGKSGGRRGSKDRVSFLWDVATSGGYSLSEALQGYAPISSNVRVTNVVAKADTGLSARLKIEGHSCELTEVVVAMNDGAITKFQLWRAADLKGFPIQIQSLLNSTPLTVTFARIRLESPPDELFRPPDGFTSYESAEAMMDELGLRQMSLKRSAPDRRGQTQPTSDREGRHSRGGP